MKNASKTAAILAICMFSTLTFARAKPFFEIGKQYLIVPRIDVVKRCSLAQLSPQEVIFKDCSVLKGTRNAGMQKAKFVEKFINTKPNKRNVLLERSDLKKNILISYSRANLTAIKLS